MSMPSRLACCGFILAAGAALLAPQAARAQDRSTGFEYGFGLIYQGSKNIGVAGESQVDLKKDLGFTVEFGYRANPHVELRGAFDWQGVGYNADIVQDSLPPTTTRLKGKLTVLSIRGNAQLNLLSGPFTPFIGAGIGWSFIDSNIGTGGSFVDCWWDPWYGYICGTFRDTYDTNSFTYQGNVGLRWDMTDAHSLRLQYQRQWLDDLGTASSKPALNQLQLTLLWRF